ncbi:hypothetical protein KTE91_03750 [Burkholderia multivorans]|uniref:hypothetical protein n=1 Tax=Burkholderia multivorans TaxID=87883 RepID=UPI001C244731|nr:hypothetical protein [Burkholderia multivorans]MBU9434198.1 hypothetical protein [Burkholderia multivorans]
MFSKKKPEGTEDQAYDLMNLGGFGGLKRKSSPGTTEPSPNGKPFENAIKQSGRTVEQVIKEQEEDISPDFYKKDPNTFSLVANYFYEVLIKVKNNLKQGEEFEVDLDGNIPMNMLKSSTAFSKDTATSYITSTFALVAAIFISLETRDLKAGERLSLLQLTKGVFGAIENFCNKEFGTETKQQTSEKNSEENPTKAQQALEYLLAWAKEEAQNNPKYLGIVDIVEQGKNDSKVLFIANIIFESFKRIIDEQDFEESDFVLQKEKVKKFISLEESEERKEQLTKTAGCIAFLFGEAMVVQICGENNPNLKQVEKVEHIMLNLSNHYVKLM